MDDVWADDDWDVDTERKLAVVELDRCEARHITVSPIFPSLPFPLSFLFYFLLFPFFLFFPPFLSLHLRASLPPPV